MKVSFTLNAKPVTVDVDPATRLADLLREDMDLTGTHIGCDTSQCGACLVLLDGESVKSCTLLVASLEGRGVTTVEGLADPDGGLHPMQTAFRENHGLQCGFCTPGMLISAVDFANRNPDPTETELRHWLEGNICRCTGYQNIVKSIMAGTAAMHQRA
ncbi:(2Fe-2S)-binding protein [Jiella marina]|uniref:(2Fe-2S)-binding protein n=1 Tax=Jiella sp. LLJ827 TaxID=2917712 RepID=UPI0021013D6A|nr:(2Fe-2S)-binding protein [Jiella sp. LLJ827]MCQ0988677.1 (2Fe-2S)-binding protein [Jiella sp. LLJ827]